MYIAKVPNRNSPPAILLRSGHREGNKIKQITHANLSDWSEARIEALRELLKGEPKKFNPRTRRSFQESFKIIRTRPHGAAATVLGTLRNLKLDHMIASKPSMERDLTVAMIVARVLDPHSKLATARDFQEETLSSTLSESLGITQATADDLYEAMDWVLQRQEKIEEALAQLHLKEGTLLLYDTTSTYFEGHTCPLAKRGNNKDGKKDKLQIVVGLLCTPKGCPIAVHVFDGNTADPKTLSAQIQKVKERFKLSRLVWVGDRGILTSARINEELLPTNGLDWITALRAPAIAKLSEKGAIQLSLFDESDLAEITDPAYLGERLIACRNPLLAQERTRKREDLLAATEKQLAKIVAATKRQKRPLRGTAKIGLRVGNVLNRYKMAKHFVLEIAEESFSFKRDPEKIAAEAVLDGIYVVRTNVPEGEISKEAVVLAYKGLSQVERAFRSLKTMDLKIRPIHHRLADRVRAHVLLCMLAYYVEWHMREALAPILFDDEDPQAGEATRKSVVSPAERSAKAKRKARRKQTADGMAVHSFQTLMKDLGTIAKNRVKPTDKNIPAFDMMTTPTPIQQRAFDLLGVKLGL